MHRPKVVNIWPCRSPLEVCYGDEAPFGTGVSSTLVTTHSAPIPRQFPADDDKAYRVKMRFTKRLPSMPTKSLEEPAGNGRDQTHLLKKSAKLKSDPLCKGGSSTSSRAMSVVVSPPGGFSRSNTYNP